MPNLSEFLGFISIGCWLGAQFPQVLENWRRRSCEGLSFPFLANWLLGDFSNLVGCILTHQLPFQTYLATYFVCVDCTLVAQYFYYSDNTKPTPPFGHVFPPHSASRTPRVSIDRGVVRYRTLSAVAANVAATAALAAHHDEQADHRRRRHARSSTDQLHSSSQDQTEQNDVDETALAALAGSVHSEAGHEARKKQVSWSIERRRRSGSLGVMPAALPTPLHSSTYPLSSTDSSHPPDRDAEDGTESEADAITPTRRNSRASRNGASILFLSAWALFGIGTLTNVRYAFYSHSASNVGKVLGIRAFDTSDPTVLYDGEASSILSFYDSIISGITNERIIGRIFAWLCTILYLTSRLPQIWKNYVRKSVEGLSMYLFVFAFLGNVFYVSSILSSPNMRLPPPQASAFINESIPYLLGSAGTLLFDITIVSQSFIYRPRHRRSSMLHSARLEEEERSLLTGEPAARRLSEPAEIIRGRSRAGA